MSIREHAEALARDGLDRAKRRRAGEQIPYDSYTHFIAVAEDATDEEAWATVVDYFESMLRGLGCTDDDLDGPTDYSSQGPAMKAAERMADEARTVMALMRRAVLDNTHGVADADADFAVHGRFQCPNGCTWSADWTPASFIRCPRCFREFDTDDVAVNIQSVVGAPVKILKSEVRRDCINLEFEVPYPCTRIPFRLMGEETPGVIPVFDPPEMYKLMTGFEALDNPMARAMVTPFSEIPWTGTGYGMDADGNTLMLRFIGADIAERFRATGCRWRALRFYFARPNMLGADFYLSEPLPKP